MVNYGSIPQAIAPETSEESSTMLTRKNAVLALGLGAVAVGAAVGLTGSSSSRTELKAKLNYVPLKPAGEMGTNRAFIGKFDGETSFCQNRAAPVNLLNKTAIDAMPHTRSLPGPFEPDQDVSWCDECRKPRYKSHCLQHFVNAWGSNYYVPFHHPLHL
jgi:hypothetical protein